jgi:D-lyxose ketol-isomerase
MKRSEINAIVRERERWVADMGFALPPWAHWSPGRWPEVAASTTEIFDNMLGWDVTDFGKGRFDTFGLVLFTIRNGNLAVDRKPYAEKIMIVDEGQGNPMHLHWHKMEDIINRGGGRFVIEMYGSKTDGEFSDEPVHFRVDGIKRSVEPGGRVVLETGESICIEQGVYHRFFAEGGRVLAGEVSMVNDDRTDNRFRESLGRYAEIEEDEAPFRLLCGDYGRFVK